MNILKPKRKIKPKHLRKIAKNRKITGFNQLWETDIKYGFIIGENRFFYIMSIIDVTDRNIIAFHIGLYCTGEDACLELKVEHERIPYKTPNMNAHIESFHRLLEEECLAINEFETYAHAYKEVHEFIKKYNTIRLHSGTEYMPPSEYFEYLKTTGKELNIAL